MSEVKVKANPEGFRRDISAPRRPVPDGACDCHMHIVGPFAKYPKRELASLDPPESLLEDYLRTSATLGLSRNIVVQPSFFARDNACTLDAVERLGERARGVVVVDADVSAEELKRMHARGARGVRVQTIARGGVSYDAIEPLAKAIAPLGWHMQIWLDARNLPEIADRLKRLPVDVVFDHMAHADETSGVEEPGFRILLDLLSTGRFWAKLSNGRFDPDGERARRLVAANPERVVWGSDWPHVSHEGAPPDDGPLLDRLWDWVPDEKAHHAALVDNPDRLYFQN